MPVLIKATERLRDKYKARFEFYSLAYYYCNHSKKSARLRKKMTEAHRLMLYWDNQVEVWYKRGLRR